MEKILVPIIVLTIYLVNFNTEAFNHRQKRQYSGVSSELNECISLMKVPSLFGHCVLDNFIFLPRSNFYCIGYRRQMERDPSYYMDFYLENGYSSEYSPPGIIEKTGILSVRFFLTNLGDTSIILKGFDQYTKPKITTVKINGRPFSCHSQLDSFSQQPQIIKTTTTEPSTTARTRTTTAATTTKEELNFDLVYREKMVVQTAQIEKEITIKAKKQECGVQKVLHESYIANGKLTYSGEFPWHSAIFKRTGKNSEYICGGSLVAKNMILTAAHCFEEGGSKIIPDRLTVQLGRSNLKKFDRSTQETNVHMIIQHDNYNYSTLNNDIAFLKLSTFVEFTDYVQPICLSMVDFPIDGQIGTVAGFGFDEMEEYAKQLKQVQLEVIEHWTCLESNRDFFGHFLSKRNYCAGFKNGSNVCSGDSGGGMYFKINNIWYLRGIVSLGFRHEKRNRCEDEDYVLFTDISKYKKWMNKFIG